VTATFEDVAEAAGRLAGVVHRTPVVTARSLDARTGGELLFKAECLQRTGAFKFRGAYNLIAQLEDPAAGLVACSSGNHAQAMALAARLTGRRALILMPADAPRNKREATEGYGAAVVEFDRYRDDRELLTRAYAEREGLTIVPAYDDPRIVAGAGTASLELFEDAGALDVVVVPVGGGGTLAGLSLVAGTLHPATQLIGVEPEANAPMHRSLAAGRPTPGPVGQTIADGQQVDAPGALNFAIAARAGARVVTVTEREIAAATLMLLERTKLVVEPSGATAFAAVLAGKVDVSGGRAGVMVTGGNLDPARLPAIASAALRRAT